jgi:large subunit ribosomal protein L32e
VKPIQRVKIVKKRTARFTRFQSDRFKRVDASWRKPKGIDSVCRRRFKGKNILPNIGFGSNKATRYVTPAGFLSFPVHNAEELETLMMQNHTFAAEIAHGVSTQKRMAIIKRAAQLKIRVLNDKAKLRVEEQQ